MARYERPMPVENASGIDNGFRKLVHNPRKILKKHINEGMVVLELGCGPGFFTPEIAKMVGKSGKVIAADLQDGMLQKLRVKIEGMDIKERVELHKCEEDRIGLSEKVDLVLAFLMMHEVVDKRKTLAEIKSILKPGGRLYIMEMIMHPPKENFEETINIAQELGFKEAEKPSFLLSRAMIFESGDKNEP